VQRVRPSLPTAWPRPSALLQAPAAPARTPAPAPAATQPDQLRANLPHAGQRVGPYKTSHPGAGRRCLSRHSLHDAALRSFVAPFLRSSLSTLAALRSLWSLQRRPAPLSTAPILRLLGYYSRRPFCASGEPLPLVGLTLRYHTVAGSSCLSCAGLTRSRWSGSALDTTAPTLTPAHRIAAAQPGQPAALVSPRQAARWPRPSQPPRR
jgi:hypothetical protein